MRNYVITLEAFGEQRVVSCTLEEYRNWLKGKWLPPIQDDFDRWWVAMMMKMKQGKVSAKHIDQ